eukprot:1269841-Prymnesium_polylepis.2
MSAIVAKLTGSVFAPQWMSEFRSHSCTRARVVARSSMTSPYRPEHVGAALGHQREAAEQAAHQRVVVRDGGIKDEHERFRSGGHFFVTENCFFKVLNEISARATW